MPYIPHTQDELDAMLKCIGVPSLDALFADIPADMRPKSFNLPEGLSESEVCAHLEGLANKNINNYTSFLGAGFYDHFIPAPVDALTSRGEFLTAYTPYQAEASQGTLQAIFEYQTAVARLMDMDVGNASVYDGGVALCEAAMMALRATGHHKLVIDEAINPLYRDMLKAFVANQDLHLITVPQKNGVSDLAGLTSAIDDNCAAVLVQNPNFFGVVEDYTSLFAAAKAKGAVSVALVYPVLQAVLKTPGEMGADIAVAEGQSLGLPLAFGGPYLGMMAAKSDLVRQLPGRIVGRTKDIEGRDAFVLTLQAREQHIRRAKATSNICSNQALCAMRSLVQLCCLGQQGLIRMAELSMERGHALAEGIKGLPGFKLLNDAPFGNEFAVIAPKPGCDIVKAMLGKNIIAGLPLGKYYQGMDNVLLMACTDKTSQADVNSFINALREM